MHLLDVAALAEHLPIMETALVREQRRDAEWLPLSTALAVECVNELRALRYDVEQALARKSLRAPELIRAPSNSSADDEVVRADRIGASEGFDSFEAARDWYLSRHPEMAGRV